MTEKLKTRKYLLLGTLALLTLLLIVLISFLSAYSTILPVVITPASYPVSYNESDDTAMDPITDPCIKEFSNKNFPDFHFDYDSCYWILKTKVLQENTQSKIKFPTRFEITLTNKSSNTLTMNISTQVSWGFEGGRVACLQYEATPINNTYTRYNWNNEDYTYSLSKNIIYKGTSKFEDLKKNPDQVDEQYHMASNTKFCIIPNLDFSFYSKYSPNDLGQGENIKEPNKKIITFFDIQLSINSNAATKRKADDVMRTFEY